jgi:hypothetical protein
MKVRFDRKVLLGFFLAFILAGSVSQNGARCEREHMLLKEQLFLFHTYAKLKLI